MVVFKGLLLEYEQKLEEWKDEGALTRRGDRRWPLPSILRCWSHLIDLSKHMSQHTTCASQDLRPVNEMPAQNQALASNVSEFLQLEVQMKFHTKRSRTEWVHAFCRNLLPHRLQSYFCTSDSWSKNTYELQGRQKECPIFACEYTLLEYLIPSTQLFFISRGTVTVTYSGCKAVFAVWTHDLIPITAQQGKRVNIFFLTSTHSFSASHSTHLLHIQGDNHSKKTGMK
jgi:hypothetical protein